MLIHYPWQTLKRGEGFFVPGLDVDEIRERGLKAALRFRYKMKATPGIKDGKLGIWFIRLL